MHQHRQGDVYLLPVGSLPQGASHKPRTGRLVLAEGEHTGHAHCILSLEAEEWIFGGETYLQVQQPVDLVHEEHTTQRIEPGYYRVIRQREYSPEAIRRVED